MKYPIIIILFLAFLHEGQAQSPVASYNFFRETIDISGNDNHLTINGDPRTEYESCKRFMKLSTTSPMNIDYLSNDNPSLNIDNAVTVTFWMRSENVGPDQKIVGQAVLGNTPRGFVMGPHSGVIKAEIFTGDYGKTMVLNSGTIMSSEWVHVAMVFDDDINNKKFEIYLNGDVSASYSGTYYNWVLPEAGDDLVVGIAPWDLSSFSYQGDLDDLQIYNTALSATQISNIFNNEGVCPLGNNPIYVDSSATGTNTGLSWANAYTDLQEAIDLSCNCPNADIWVAKGTYYPTQDNPASSDNTDRDVTFFIDHPVEIYGGFPSGGTLVSRDWNIYKTSLNGALLGTQDSALHVVYMAGEQIKDDWVVDGFFIENGKADKSGHSDGAGMFIESGSGDFRPVISNCTFINNEANENGGGLFMKSANIVSTETESINNAKITGCSFINNQAKNGAGLYVYTLHFLAEGQMQTTVSSCTFENNVAQEDGGGLYMFLQSLFAPTGSYLESKIINSTFQNNIALNSNSNVSPGGGAMYFNNFADAQGITVSTHPTIDNCTVVNNAAYAGGAIRLQIPNSVNTNTITTVAPIINNSIFWGNTATSGFGADISMNSSTTGIKGTISHSIIAGSNVSGDINYQDNLQSDPLLMSDLTLMPNSPAINAGVNDSIPSGITTDLAGNPRINYGTVDMGAYEAELCAEIVGDIIYVDSAATGNGTGLDWANAITNLQDAINTSKTCVGDQEIWVAKGTYHPSFDNPTSHESLPQDYTFYIDHPTKIYGGFDGTETMLSERDWYANVTILDGAFPGTMDTALHVVLMDAPATICEDWVLDGLQITNGRSTSTFGINSSGAGLKLLATTQASPTISNCTFYNNKATVNGGAIDANLSDGSTDDVINMIVSNCTFYDNHAGAGTAGSGGAIYLNTPSSGNNAPTFINSLFYNNTAQGNGGAISATSSGISGSGYLNLEMINCTVGDNEGTGNGGGIYMNADVDAFKIYNSIFWNNTGTQGDDIFTNSDQGSIDSTILSQSNNAIAANDLLVGNYFTQDPLFISPGSDYSLTQASPAINAGKNDYVPWGVDTDISGGQRILNGQVDIGAYEVAACGMDILYVDIDAASGGDGLSWATAFTDLQDALDVSALCTGVQSIWIAEGYYYPTKVFDANEDGTLDDRERTFYINHNVKIYGGFDGTETDVSQRDKVNHRTILDGDHGGPGAFNDHSYHVMFIDSDASGSTIDMTTEIVDVEIRGGLAEGGGINSNGGGVYIRASATGASPIFSGCTFDFNRSSTDAGAVYNLGVNGGTNATSFVNCSFTSNSAEFTGGAVYNFADGQNTKVASSFVNCVFLSNDAIEGIAIYNHASVGETASTIVNCSFSSHSNNGAVIHNSNSTATISNSILWNPGNAEIENASGSSAVVTYSIIDGGLPDQTTGSNNLDTDPLFTSSSNLTLMSTSSAINAGRNDSLPTGVTLDIAGLDRINCDTIDMGAHEFQVPLQISCSGPVDIDADMGACTITKANANLILIAPTANCGIATVTNDAPDPLPLGPTTVTWTVTDTDGRQESCTQEVTVVDSENPTITCPDDITITRVAGSCGSTIDIGMATATDNCTGMITVVNDAPTDFPPGTTTITWTATDANMNMQTCTQIVTVNEVTPSCPMLGDSIFVDSAAMGGSTGLTWDDAFVNLQDAIDLACDCAMGDTIPEIHVMEGTYYPCKEFDADESGGSDPREATFYINKNLKIYGGYFIDFESDIFRDRDNHPTILSGDIGVKDDVSDNSYHVMYVDGTTTSGIIDRSMILDGLIIQEGMANGISQNGRGGGLLAKGETSYTIRNCSFSHNYADFGGGAINLRASLDGVPALIENCSFRSNIAKGINILSGPLGGGGALFVDAFDESLSLTIKNSTFTNNVSTVVGGAIHYVAFRDTLKSEVINCLFSDNNASAGTTIYVTSIAGFSIDANAIIDITNSTFVNNYEDQNTATLHATSRSNLNNGAAKINANINNSIFWNDGEEIIVDPIDPSDTESQADVTVTNSLIEDATQDGTIDPIDGVTFMGTNLDAYPMFQDSMNGNFRLMEGSPAIDAGDNSLVQSVYDITGSTPRIMDQVDMGVYEFGAICNETLRFYLPGVFNNKTETFDTSEDIEISSGILNQSDILFNMKTGMTMLKEFEIEAGSKMEVILEGCVD